MPGHSRPPATPADRDRHVVYGGALGHVDRIRDGRGTRRALVPAVDRGPDRAVDRLHGVRKHARIAPGPPLADRVRLRPGAWIRLLVCVARIAAVRGSTPGNVAPLLQCGRGTRPSRGANRGDSGAGMAVPTDQVGPRSDHLALRARGAHRMALDAGAGGDAARV